MSEAIDQLRTMGVLEVAGAGDLHVRGRSFGPCPACGAETRSTSDKRLPVSSFTVEGGLTLARCWRCEVTLDAVALAAFAAAGAPLSNLNWREVVSWAASRGLCSQEVSGKPHTAPTPAGQTAKPTPWVLTSRAALRRPNWRRSADRSSR